MHTTQTYSSHLIMMWLVPVAHITDKFALLNVTAANNDNVVDRSDLFYCAGITYLVLQSMRLLISHCDMLSQKNDARAG
jgi:hypothetical protein